MPKVSWFRKLLSTTFFKTSEVALGEGSVTQHIIWENKYLCSCIIYKWNTIDQVRAHSHAFTAVAFLLRGWYWEDVLLGGRMVRNIVNQPLWPRVIPRGYVHSVRESKPGTMTLLLCGPWQPTWWEYFKEGTKRVDAPHWVQYAWGRNPVYVRMDPPSTFVDNGDPYGG